MTPRPDLSPIGLLRLLGPLSVVTALLFYFGWVRTNAIAQSFGLNPRLLDLSTGEYVLRSIGPMLVPVTVGAVILGACAALTGWMRSGARADAPWLADRRLPVLFGSVGAVLGFIGLIRLPGAETAEPASLTPALLFAAAALLFYAAVIAGLPARWRGDGEGGRGAALYGLALILGLAGAFLFVFREAHAYGVDQARALKRNPTALPAVEIYSRQSLGLETTGASVERVADPDSAYRFHYANLRLLQFANDRYFLIDGTPGGATRTVIVPASNDLGMRVELRPLREATPPPAAGDARQ